MQTAWDARIHAGPPQAMQCSLTTSSSPSPASGRSSSPAPAPSLSITLWPVVWLKHVGSSSSFRSSMLSCQRALSSTTITSASSTSPPTLFSTSAPSMSRSTFTSSGNALQPVMSASCTYQRPPNSQTSSQRVYSLQCFQNFGPLLTFPMARVLTVRGVGKYVVT
jgi:transglutaminase/protease-like cytokinesis protein 3